MPEEQAHRRNIAFDLKRWVVVKPRMRSKIGGVAAADGVAVGPGLREDLHAQHLSAARTVSTMIVAPSSADMVRTRWRNSTSCGRVRQDDANRFGRVGLGKSGARHCIECHCE